MKIWIAATYDLAHKNGGWGIVRADGEVSGWAGGERMTSRSRMALAALAAALKDLPPGVGPTVLASRPDALALHTLVKPPPEPITDDLELRAVLAKALAGRPWALTIADPKVVAPLMFAAAWADRAADKAKTQGPFTAAIPKVNLAKLKDL